MTVENVQKKIQPGTLNIQAIVNDVIAIWSTLKIPNVNKFLVKISVGLGLFNLVSNSRLLCYPINHLNFLAKR